MSSRGKLDLDPGVIASCREAASQIAGQVAAEIAGKTTVSVERTIARLLGVDGANELDAPLPNVLVDHVRDAGELGRGIAYWLGNALLAQSASSDDEPPSRPSRSPKRSIAASSTCSGCRGPSEEAIHARIAQECEQRVGRDRGAHERAARAARAPGRAARRRFATC